MKINDIAAQNVIDRYLNGEQMNAIAKEHGVVYGCILAIVRGTSRKYLIRPNNILEIMKDRNESKYIDYNKSILPDFTDHQKKHY